MKPKRLFEEIFSAATTALENFHSDYINIITQNISGLTSLKEKLKDAANTTVIKKQDITKIHSAVNGHLVDLKQWIGESVKTLNILYDKEPWAGWTEQAEVIIAKLEEIVNLPYIDEIALPDSFHSILLQLSSKLQGIRYRIRLKKFKKKIDGSPSLKFSRTFKLHNFIRYYQVQPVSEHFFEIWQQYLHFLSDLLFRVHNGSEQLKDDVLCTNMLGPDQDYWSLLGDHKTSENLNSYFAILDQIQNDFDIFQTEIKKTSVTFLQNLSVNLDEIWIIAGSPYCLPQRFREKKITQKQNVLIRKREKALPGWEEHLKSTYEEWLKDLELSDIQFQGIEIFNETLKFIKQKLNDKVHPVFRDIEENVGNTLRKIETGKTISDETLKSHILIENRALVKNLRLQKLPQLMDAITQSNFQQTIRGFFLRMNALIEEMRNEYLIFRDRDLDHRPPDSSYVEVRLKDLIQDEIILSAEKEYKTLLDNFRQDLEGILRGVSSLDQIVEFNLEAAYNLLMEKSDKESIVEARKIAVEGLERTLGNLNELQGDLIKLISKTSEKFSAIVQDIEFDIQKLGDNEKIFELKLRLARAKTREKYKEIRRQIWIRIKIVFPTVVKKFNQAVEKIKSGIFRIQKVTRLGPQEIESKDSIARFLISTYQKINKMPYVYQRLFRLDPLEEKRFFYGRSDQIEELQSYFDQYKNGFSTSIAIIGEKGNGKTTILNFADKEIFKGVEVIRIDSQKNITTENELVNILKKAFNYPSVNTLDEFDADLQNDEKRRICCFENIHNLFTRTIDGFELIERFLLMISNTRSHIFWLITSGLYGWEYLDKVVNSSDYFKKVLYLKPLNRIEVMEIILKRHQVSGYGLWFEEPEKASRSRQYRKLTTDEEKQDYLKELFFEDLLDESGGNIKSAILFWLSALKKFDEEKIDIAEEVGVDYSIIYRLTSDELFTLAALIQQEYLTHEQHARIFNQELNSSRSILGRLYKKGFLDRSDSKYSVHPFMYLPVVKTLKTKNILN
jgi:hypothetical protein